MSTALQTAMAELEARLALIGTASGFNTNLGASMREAGAYLDESDAPCMALYEAKPGDDGVMMVPAGTQTACGQEFAVRYMVQAYVKRSESQTPLVVAEAAAQDIMRALMGANRGALAGAKGHRIEGHGRGLTPKGGNVIPVLVYGALTVSEGIYQ
ncbi:MAG: hypothetical protein LT080_10385 [Thiobacillus sp.]|nr:hypothetical protein [Thiobacillus sp.]